LPPCGFVFFFCSISGFWIKRVECEEAKGHRESAEDMRLILKVAVCLTALLITAANAQQPINYNNVDTTIQDAKNQTVEEIENKLKSFFHESRNKLYLAFYNLSSYIPLDIDYAETVGKECDILEYNQEYYTTVGLVLGGLLGLIGIVFAFFGYRLIKIVLFLIGFVIGCSLTYFTILAFSSDHLHETWVPYTAVAVSVVVGIICGVLTICVYYIGIFLAGASIGFLITWFILAAIDIPFFREHIYVPVIGAAVGAVTVGLMSLWIQKWFFMLGTAILGSFMICWGVDYFLELGAMVYYLLLFAEHRSRLEPCWYSWGVISLFVACGVAAFIVQAVLTGRKYDHRKELKGQFI
jgi:hypothetical protein